MIEAISGLVVIADFISLDAANVSAHFIFDLRRFCSINNDSVPISACQTRQSFDCELNQQREFPRRPMYIYLL